MTDEIKLLEALTGKKVTLRESFDIKAIEAAFQRQDELNSENEEEGNEFVICTNIASWVRDNFFQGKNAKIVGYYSEDNPEAEIGQGDGHDFLLVDDRYIIDFWPRYVEGMDTPVLLDLQKDAAQVKKLYGDKNLWKTVKG